MNSPMLLTRQIGALHSRLETLYANLDPASGTLSTEAVNSVWKDLGVATEALQAAQEELQQRSDQMARLLEETSRQHRYYQNLIDHIPESYLTTTLEGKIQEANLMAAWLFNLPQSALIGKLLVGFVPPEQRQVFWTELLHLAQASRPHTWTCWFQPSKLTPIHLTLTVSPAIDAEQEQKTLHWILREVNEAWVEFASLPQVSLGDEADQALFLNRPILHCDKGEVIALNQQNLWLVHEGLVKLHTLTEDNEEVLLGVIGPGMPFGCGSSFLPVYQATALTDVQLLQFSQGEVKASPQLAQLLLPKFDERLQQQESLLSISGQRRVRQRLLLLLRLLKQIVGEPFAGGVRLRLRLTHEEIASACCTSRVTITRLLGELQRQQKVAIDSRFHLIILDTEL